MRWTLTHLLSEDNDDGFTGCYGFTVSSVLCWEMRARGATLYFFSLALANNQSYLLIVSKMGKSASRTRPRSGPETLTPGSLSCRLAPRCLVSWP